MPKINTTLYGELTLLPFQPQPPIRERLGWLTDVINSRNATEDRTERRTAPRQFFNYSVPLNSTKKAAAFNTHYDGIRDDWAIPVWTEMQEVGDLLTAQTVITCDTVLFDLREDSLALIINSVGLYELVEIDTITPTDITLIAGLSQDITDAILLPARVGILLRQIRLNTTGFENVAQVNFQVRDNLAVVGSTPDQYLGFDIYYDESELLDGVRVNKVIEKRQEIVDYELGVIDHSTPWTDARYSAPINVVMDGHTDVQAFKDFLYRRAGRFREFWQPTFENDIRSQSTGLVTGILLVDSDYLIDHMQGRTHIAIKDRFGVWHPREITAYITIDPDTVQLNITPDLNIQGEAIDYISWLGLNRLNSDDIELTWGSNNIVTSAVPAIELTP